MTKDGYVVFCDKDKSQFELMYNVGGGCGKGCVSCSSTTDGCSIKSFGPFSYNKSEFNVGNGNSVTVEIYPKTHLIPSVIMLILPILEFFFAYWLYSKVTINIFILISIILVGLYFTTLILFNKRWKTIIKGEVTKVIR